jgi:hypothetical protein
VVQRRDAQKRPCSIEAAPLKEVADFAEHYRHLWESRLDRLENYLKELKAKEKRHGRQQRRKQ